MKGVFARVLGCGVALLAAASGMAQAPTPPFRQCPPIGLNTGCAVLITFQKDGKPRVDRDPSQRPFDGIEDTTVGVQNNSNRPIFSISLKSSTDIFGFDGDGLCNVSPRPGGCPFGPTGYEGPGVSFSNINGSRSAGTVSFAGGIRKSGGTAFFSLEEANFQLVLCGSDDPDTTEDIFNFGTCGPLGTKTPTWGSFGSKSALVADSGEKLELKCEGPGGSLPSFHLYYTPPGGTPFRVGTCPFVEGCNNGTFTYAGKNSATGNPKCFVRTFWRSRDYGDNDVPNPWTRAGGVDTTRDEPVLDWAITNYDVVSNNLTKSDQEFKYNPAVTPRIPPVPNASFCSRIPPIPAEGRFVKTVRLADPPLGPDTEAFFARADLFLQDVGTPDSPPMAEGAVALGDINADGVIDSADFQALRQAFGACTGQDNYNPAADLDGDDCVNFKDLRVFLQLFQLGPTR
ncbi:MAG TPA: dockerin type I domain-containing protein [Candidatus Angelobacter sp.]|nr:dockerin type I domain-containing protein [Candidatus Angelobacter sp.]